MRKLVGDEAAIIKSICDDPDDDTPRLVYADWLDEHATSEAGRARAAFIRLQIAEAVKREPDPHNDVRLWTKQEKELYKPHYKTWASEVPEYRGVNVWTGNEHGNGYERGFPFYLYAKSVRSYLKAAPDVFTRVPITKVRFQSITDVTARELTRSPWLARIQYLDQLNGIEPGTLETLANSPHMGNLRRILLGGQFTAGSLRPFLANPSLTRLEWVNTLQCGRVGSGILAAVAASTSAPVLKYVALFGNGIGPDAATDLPAVLRLPSLMELNLGWNQLGDDGLAALARTTTPGPLGVFFNENRVTDTGANAIFSGAFFRGPAAFLALNRNNLTDTMKNRLKEAFGDRVVV